MTTSHGSGVTTKTVQGRRLGGGTSTSGWHGVTQSQICATYEAFLESVVLYGIGAIRITTLKPDGSLMASLASLRAVAAGTDGKKMPAQGGQ